MSTSNDIDNSVEKRLLAQLLAAQGVLQAFAETRTLSEFVAHLLLDVPGVGECSVCLRGLDKPIVSSLDALCQDCAVFDGAEDARQRPLCLMADQADIFSLPMQTPSMHYGYIILKVVDARQLAPYLNHLRNFANFAAMIMENTRQKAQLEISNASLVSEIAERNAMEEALRRAQKMEAVGQLAGGIAHDFNNLMGVMIGNAEMLRDQVGDNEKARRRADAIIGSVQRGASLTQRLLAFSRQQVLSPQSRVIDDLVLGLGDMLHRTLGETVELRSELGSGTSEALIDPHQFEDVLINLAINARDAMPKGGVLAIRTADVTLDKDHAAQYEDVTPGDYVKVTVSDTGIGMSPETVEKAFEPFFTTKEVGEGSGLGLSMVYGFAKQSNGHVTITSELGHGTVIDLYLPKSGQVRDRTVPKNETPEPVRGSERVLIVEDDEALRDIPVTMLLEHGYEVVEAGDGKEAIKYLQKGQPFDLLFTDVVLPGGMNGMEIANEAKRLQPGIKVLFTSGYAQPAVAHNGKLDRDVILLNKPYLRATLLEKVRAVLDGAND